MEALLRRESLHDALELVFIALDSKTGPLGHSFILFRLEDQVIRITGFSPDLTVSAIAEPTEADDDFVLALPGKTLKDIFRKIKGDFVRLKRQDHTSSLQCGRSTFRFGTLTRDHFPKIIDTEINQWHETEISKLLRGFQKVSFSISADDNRANLKSIHIDANNYIASDSFRMSVYSNKDMPLSTPISLSRICCGKIVKLLKRLDGQCRVGTNATYFSIESNTISVIARAMALQYPDYVRAIPKTDPTLAVFDKDDLQGALERILIVADESESVEIHLNEGIAALATKSTNNQAGRERLECDFPGVVKFKINGRYLLDVANHLDGDKVNIEVRKDKVTKAGAFTYPLVIQEDNYVNLIMPKKF